MYSLITTVYNEEASILSFIQSLNKQTIYPNEFIIVDGGSTDKTLDLINESISEKINYKLIVDDTCNKKHTVGPIAKGRNVAIKNTKHENILVTDAGCVLDENWVKQMIHSFEKQNADIVSGWYKANVSNKFQSKIADIFCPPINKINKKTFLPSSRSLGFKKWLWKKVGGYPENSYTAEDTLFDIKIFKLTDNIVFNEKAFVYWDVPFDKEELNKKLFEYGFGEGRLRIFLFHYIMRLALLICFPILLLLILLKYKNIMTFRFYYYQLKGYIKGYYLKLEK
ncbi:glycosyltransferase [Aquimarina sp. I32.4]|uniref:glycosyltransferase n=1 Tax=Aquimarina sp. I32.4 TaxID=2053903 RepID=UPI000CDE5F1E|nr:glycosyltransferase [Aquimarina sp. I32.4]